MPSEDDLNAAAAWFRSQNSSATPLSTLAVFQIGRSFQVLDQLRNSVRRLRTHGAFSSQQRSIPLDPPASPTIRLEGKLPDFTIQQRLCDACKAIPLQSGSDSQFELSSTGESRKVHYVVGVISDIITKSSCPFCVFIHELWQFVCLNDVQHHSTSIWNKEIVAEICQPCVTTHHSPSASRHGGSDQWSEDNQEIFLELCFRRDGRLLNVDRQIYITSLESANDNSRKEEEPTASQRSISLPRCSSSDDVFGKLNSDRAAEWLSICAATHLTCNKKIVMKDPLFGLKHTIDVKWRTIVSYRPEQRYIALSYVWGKRSNRPPKVSGMKGSSERSDPEFKANGRFRLPEVLPKTIEDAMTVVKLLGERYLWVDAYCIDQTNEYEQRIQMKNMDSIYANAYLTIVAASGKDSAEGLPGISKPLLYTTQPTVRMDTIQFRTLTAICSLNLDLALEAAPWKTRAWTMQEGVLSTRLLLFTADHVFLKCKEEVFIDVLPTKYSRYFHRAKGNESLRSDWLDQRVWMFSEYAGMISEYTKRQLSHSADVLNAFAGILNRIETNTGVVFSYGIPRQDTVSGVVVGFRGFLAKPESATTLSFMELEWMGGPCEVLLGDDTDLYKQTLRVRSTVVTLHQDPGEGLIACHYDGEEFVTKPKRIITADGNKPTYVELLLIRQWGTHAVSALVIKRHNDGTASRVDIVTILLKDWQQAKPRPSTVTLR